MITNSLWNDVAVIFKHLCRWHLCLALPKVAHIPSGFLAVRTLSQQQPVLEKVMVEPSIVRGYTTAQKAGSKAVQPARRE